MCQNLLAKSILREDLRTLTMRLPIHIITLIVILHLMVHADMMGNPPTPTDRLSQPSQSYSDSLPDNGIKRLQISGYVKYMQSTLFTGKSFNGIPPAILDQLLGRAIHDHLIHHRLNASYAFSPQVILNVGWRNRILFGDQARLFALSNMDYAASIDEGTNDVVDLSFVPFKKRAGLAHSVLDRLSLEWRGKHNEIIVGRQRINWSLTAFWNPHDLFNAYSFIDFDYEERPGVDAVRWAHYRENGHQLEVAIRPADSLSGSTAAAIYKGSKGRFHYQFLTGYFQSDIALGVGWETDLGPAAWKVESTFFQPYQTSLGEEATFSLATDFLYSWESGLITALGYLLNTNGTGDADLFAEFSQRLSPKNLFPYRHSFFVQSSYSFTPLISASLGAIYSPGEANTLLILPVLAYSIAQDWDLDLTGQILARDDGKTWNSPLQAVFLRFRYSY